MALKGRDRTTRFNEESLYTSNLGYRVKSGNFGHQVSRGTMTIQMRWLIISLDVRCSNFIDCPNLSDFTIKILCPTGYDIITYCL